MNEPEYIKTMRLADKSDCGRYRYRLDRHINAGHLRVAFIGINPSVADAEQDDQTVRKWNGFAERLGVDRYMVGNIFPFIETDVKNVKNHEIISEATFQNVMVLGEIIDEAHIIIPCWGSRGKIPKAYRFAVDDMERRLRESFKPLMCWGKTQSGDPKHPLMLGYDTPLVKY